MLGRDPAAASCHLLRRRARHPDVSPRQREAVLRDGLPGLVRTAEDNAGTGIWKRFDRRAAEDDLSRRARLKT